MFPIVVPWKFFSLRYGADLRRSRLVFFFSWQSHSEWSTFLTICSSFIFVHLPSSTQPESVGSILPLNHKFFNASKSTGETKGSPFGFFLALCDFFRKFLKFIKGYPLAFFSSFRFVKTFNEPKWPLFGFSALCDFFYQILFFWKKNFFPNFSNSCSLNIFEPKIWRRLGTFPSCFFFSLQSHSEWSTFLTILT